MIRLTLPVKITKKLAIGPITSLKDSSIPKGFRGRRKEPTYASVVKTISKAHRGIDLQLSRMNCTLKFEVSSIKRKWQEALT